MLELSDVCVGHYGNAISLNDVAEWAGVSVGVVNDCTKRCMIAVLSLHDTYVALPTAEEKEASKAWAEATVLPQWRNGFLAVDGTTIPLFQKPGFHGEVWYDKSSNYSTNAQVSIFFHFQIILMRYLVGGVITQPPDC